MRKLIHVPAHIRVSGIQPSAQKFVDTRQGGKGLGALRAMTNDGSCAAYDGRCAADDGQRQS